MRLESVKLQWLYCFKCKGRRLCEADRCQKCGQEGCIMAWDCKKCGKTVRGNAPDGPLLCGECPEPLATFEECLEFLDDNGDSRVAGDSTLDECRDCKATIRRTNGLPRGAAQCMPCAVGRLVTCTHPHHRGPRKVPARTAQFGTYVCRTKGNRDSRRTETLCFSCFNLSGAITPSDVAGIPALAALEETPFILHRSPRDSYARDQVIFDETGTRALDEKRVIRLHPRSIKTHEWRGVTVQWIECEELRLVGDSIETRASVTFNRRVIAKVRRQVDTKREAQRAFNAAHKGNARLCVDPSSIDVSSLGWFLLECNALNSDGRACFDLRYPSVARDESTVQWALRALK